jgi:hypothetical protein
MRRKRRKLEVQLRKMLRTNQKRRCQEWIAGDFPTVEARCSRLPLTLLLLPFASPDMERVALRKAMTQLRRVLAVAVQAASARAVLMLCTATTCCYSAYPPQFVTIATNTHLPPHQTSRQHLDQVHSSSQDPAVHHQQHSSLPPGVVHITRNHGVLVRRLK